VNMLRSVLESMLRFYKRAYKAVSVPSSGIRHILESMLGSLLENVLGGVPRNGYEVNLEAS